MNQDLSWEHAPSVHEEYPYILPWWLRGQQPDYCWWTPHDPYSQYFQAADSQRGYFTESFPHILPFYPIYSSNPKWIDPWSMQGYHGYWWS